MKTTHAAILLLAVPALLAAQATPPANPITTVLKNRTLGLQRNIAQAFDSIPESKFAYKPTPAQLTIGYIAQHVASDDYLFCNAFGTTKATVSDGGEVDAGFRKSQMAEGQARRAAQSIAQVLRGRVRAARRREARRADDDGGWGARAASRSCADGRWTRARPRGSLQPDRELHASEQSHSAVGAPEAGSRGKLENCNAAVILMLLRAKARSNEGPVSSLVPLGSDSGSQGKHPGVGS